MEILKQHAAQSRSLPALILVTACVVSGCAGSSDPVDSNPVVDDPVVEDPVVENPVVVDPVVVDPVVANRVVVNFEITVPMYQSNALLVELVWGDMNLTAMWVGDEFWSASGEFPTETEHPLSVTFYDLNGDIELAGFTQAFRTGSNATESFQITADMFDANQFDSDEDGVNNLAELIAETDPLNDEDSQLEIFDYFALSTWSRMSVSQVLESHLSQERPFFDTFDSTQNESVSTHGNVDIDAEGNGTLMYAHYHGSESLRLNGIRTNSESSISWEGTREAYDGDYHHNVNFTNTVTVVDENTRDFVEEIAGSNIGTYTYRWETSSNLTGNLIDGTSLCVPVAGTVSTTYRTSPGQLIEVTTISKEIDDPYWRVEMDAREYFVRELRMLRSNAGTYTTDTPDSAFFICDFVDI